MRRSTQLLERLLRMPRRHLLAGVVALVLLAGAAGWVTRPERHTLSITGLEQPMTFVTTQQQLGDALHEQGITLGQKDLVSPDLTTSLKGQKQLAVSIVRAKSLTVVDGGQELQVESTAQRVSDLLQELNLTVGASDTLSVPLGAPVTAGMALKITRRTDVVVTEDEEIPYETVTREDSGLMMGTTEVRQEGAPGRRQIERRISLEDGREIASEVVSDTVVSEPVPEILAYGTQGVVSRGGQEFRYTRELDMVATGYTAGKESNPNGNGITYTGMPAAPGVVAVDPNVIPLYSRLYIEGYGPAIAGDIGGAIQGDRIDLCFGTVGEALSWGVRTVKVYVLSD